MSRDLGGFTKEEAEELDAALDAAYEDGDLTKSSEPEDEAKSSKKSAAGEKDEEEEEIEEGRCPHVLCEPCDPTVEQVRMHQLGGAPAIQELVQCLY